MKIWVDGYEANVPQRLGSSQVAFNLLKHLERLDKRNEYTILLPNLPLDDLPKERTGWRYQLLKPNRLKTWLAIPFALFTAKEKPDLFFSPTHYGPGLSPVPRVITIFDLAFSRFPNFFKPRDLWQLKIWTWISVHNAKHIVTISKATRDDLKKYYGVGEDKVTVAYPGFDKKFFQPGVEKKKVEEVKGKYGIQGEYALYIGTVQPRKNLVRLIEAFKNIENLKLVIVGKTTGVGRQGWMFEEVLGRPKKLGIEDKVIFTGYASREDLPGLIKGAKVFVWPSLWEGFGIPVVEAMACGTPVVTSDVSSLPEVVGGAGIKVNPYSVEEIERAIRAVAFDVQLRRKLSKQGLKQAWKFSWEKMTRTVLKVFEGLGGEEGEGGSEKQE